MQALSIQQSRRDYSITLVELSWLTGYYLIIVRSVSLWTDCKPWNRQKQRILKSRGKKRKELILDQLESWRFSGRKHVISYWWCLIFWFVMGVCFHFFPHFLSLTFFIRIKSGVNNVSGHSHHDKFCRDSSQRLRVEVHV